MSFPKVNWAAICLATLCGCGYSSGLATLPEDARKIAVEVASNDTYWQRREIPLTRAILAELAIHTKAQPARRSEADAVLEVRIAGLGHRTMVPGSSTPVVEGALQYEVEVQLIARRSGQTLRQVRLLDQAEYRTGIGEGRSSAEGEATQDLARKIVLSLEPKF